MTSLMQAAIAGAGIALLPAYLVNPVLREGQLISVLSDWQAAQIGVCLVSVTPPPRARGTRAAGFSGAALRAKAMVNSCWVPTAPEGVKTA
jgi:DNA-binding transcriptional LysR family regulator